MELNNPLEKNIYSTNLKVKYDSSYLFNTDDIIHFICDNIKIILKYQKNKQDIEYSQLVDYKLDNKNNELSITYYNNFLFFKNRIIFKIKTGFLSEHLNILEILNKYKKKYIETKQTPMYTDSRKCVFCSW